MQISFGTADLKQCCLYRDAAEKKYGRTYADRLVTELADAEAFENVHEWHEILGGNLKVNDDDSFEVVIGSGYRATFVSVDQNVALASDGRIVWASVEFVKLTAISEVP